MSQAGIVDIERSHPQIPTIFVTNDGTAIPIANVLEILGEVVAAYGIPLQTTGSGNTVTIVSQYASASASSSATHAGLASFDSTFFSVDANGYVTFNGSGSPETITGNTGGPLSPTAGNWNIFGSSVAAGTTPVQTVGSVSTLTVQVQRAQAIASTNATNVGLAAFSSTYFSVDGNGFVTLNGSAVGETITGNSGGALSPTAGNWNILGAGSLTTAGSGSTLTVQLTGLTNHAVQVGGASTTLTQVGPSATTGAVLASNGAAADPSFQTISSLGAITTITGNSGGAESPSAGNFNILGTGSITVAGSANTETVQLTGLTNHNVLVGAGTATITNVAPSATSGVPLISQGSSSDPAFGTAVVAGGGTGDTSFTAYSVICGGTTSTGALQNVSGVGSSGQVLTSNGASALPTWQPVGNSGAITTVAIQTITSSGTYTPTSGMVYCVIEVVGAGGGGGGVTGAAGGVFQNAGGGGGGGYARGIFTAAAVGASQSVTVGGGGAGGATGTFPTGNGATGGTTSITGLSISATGGGGGQAGTGSNNTTPGGSGGGGSGGSFQASGGGGGPGFDLPVQWLIGGNGGDSVFAGGAAWAVGGNAAANGSSYGGGGAGAGTSASSGSFSGGNGAGGIIVITEYCT